MFGIMVALGDRYPALDPLKLRATRIDEFCALARMTLQHQKRKAKAVKRSSRRPAGDDWFRPFLGSAGHHRIRRDSVLMRAVHHIAALL